MCFAPCIKGFIWIAICYDGENQTFLDGKKSGIPAKPAVAGFAGKN